MEMLRTIVKQYYPLLIMFSCVFFVIWIFFADGRNGKKNVFEGAGEVVSPVVNSGEVRTDGLSYVGDVLSGYVPVLTYTGGAQTAGTYIPLKSMFDVTLEDGTIVNGSSEDGFTIYLADIKNAEDDSALLFLTAEDIVGMEEIPAPFVYEKELDILCCFQGGIYTVYVEIYGEDGGEDTYIFSLPVEIS